MMLYRDIRVTSLTQRTMGCITLGFTGCAFILSPRTSQDVWIQIEGLDLAVADKVLNYIFLSKAYNKTNTS
jgi:hypothetical protein